MSKAYSTYWGLSIVLLCGFVNTKKGTLFNHYAILRLGDENIVLSEEEEKEIDTKIDTERRSQ